jgi:hypothetical protein
MSRIYLQHSAYSGFVNRQACEFQQRCSISFLFDLVCFIVFAGEVLLTEMCLGTGGNLLHITVPLGSKASLITVTIPPLIKYPSVSLAASWTLSALIIYKTNKSCENNCCQIKSSKQAYGMQCYCLIIWITSSELFCFCSQVKKNQMQQQIFQAMAATE